jgi:hypothetical protein
MKLNKSELREIIREELNQIEEVDLRSNVTTSDADKFILDVLRLGTKNNLFDMWMRKNKISPNELSTLVGLVTTQLRKNWS